ncbi:hypothetical protein WJX72_010126 [[Myrmecia] bisecta]|uniref:Uncharacterized protein n=1 Tax=[Myrmecia] bisecta TaxID=41462 RepID=A0AAW1PGK9_9CHLO
MAEQGAKNLDIICQLQFNELLARVEDDLHSLSEHSPSSEGGGHGKDPLLLADIQRFITSGCLERLKHIKPMQCAVLLHYASA